MQLCPTCSTPLDPEGRCGACAAVERGLVALARADYPTVRQSMDLLEGAGLSASLEKVPPVNERELQQPRWTLYVPREELERAGEVLGQDWRGLVEDEAALEAARRGTRALDLDAGGEVTCPACGATFVAAGRTVECPDCGLSLGAPDEGEG
jgi:hypothetical protein